MRTINRIIIHCSATPEGKHYTAKNIDQWHRQRGYNSIGYHYVVLLDGTIQQGRTEDQIGAHTKGYNATSIGVCYIGGLATDGRTAKDTRTEEQKRSLYALLKDLRQRYPKARIHSHRDFAPKACPSFDATKEYKDI